MSGDILVFGETRDGSFRRVCGELLTQFRSVADAWSRRLGVVLVGDTALGDVPQLSEWGADVVIRLPGLPASDGPETLSDLLGVFVRDADPSLLLFGNTPLARTVAPRVAEGSGAAFAGDCVAFRPVEDGLQLSRLVYGGKLLSRVHVDKDSLAVVTFRPNALGFREAAARTATQESAAVPLDGSGPRSTIVESAVATGGRVSLQEAEIIVSGGRGLGDAEGFAVIEELADALGGAVGASRVAVDSGWISVDHQVGQTGKAVSPNLYVACGISGAIQHFAGMGSSRVIVAINKDPDCPMCEKADYTVVGDLYKLAPALAAELRRMKDEA
jgi:electron transfer flavoprotein alpha subunit